MRRIVAVVVVSLAVILALRLMSATRADDIIQQAIARAQPLAAKWQSDARLVQVVVGGFGFATGANGVPDVTKSGPPSNAVLYFYSPSRGKNFEVMAMLNMTPEQLKMMQQFGQSDLRGQPVEHSVSPYTLPLPVKLVDFNQALTRAQAADLGKDCAGANPMISSCGKTTGAELHLYWSGEGEEGTPIWTFDFGQHPKTLATVARQVEAAGAKLVVAQDKQATSLEPTQAEAALRQRIDRMTIDRDFMSVARMANEAITAIDPLYKLYAAAVVLGIDENQATPDAKVRVVETHLEFAKSTPSRYWDNLELRVEFGAENQAVVRYIPSPRMVAPEQPRPAPIDFAKMPDADPFLRRIVKQFPRNYREVWITYENGCEKELSVSPSISVTRCGVLIPVKHSTDRIYLWLHRAGNPYWYAQNGLSEAEFRLVSDHAPRSDWIWWARVKHSDQWRYEIVDIDTRKEIVGCAQPVLASGHPPVTVACHG